MNSLLKYLLAGALLASCSANTSPENASQENPTEPTLIRWTEAQALSAGITIGKMESRSVSGAIKVNGSIDVPPQNMVTISAPLGGFIKHTELLEGMKVGKGQVIAVMEHPDYIQLQQDYLESSSQLNFYQAEFERQQELAKENINAGKTLQQAETNYKTTQAKVEGLKARLALLNLNPETLDGGNIKNSINIYSPIAGFVTQVNVNKGMYVNPTDVLFKIVDTNHLHAQLVVFEKDILNIKIGQKVRLRVSNEPSERMATVYLVGKEITPERTVMVHCHLDREDDALLPGMYLNAVIENNTGQSPTLPLSAVVNYNGDNFVFVVRDSDKFIYEMIKVSVGQHESGYIEVQLPDGIDADASFVTQGSYDLLSFLKNTEED